MKKEVIVFSILILLFLPLVSAIEIEMNENFSSGETLIAKVSGNFLEPPTKANIFFYQGSVLDSNFQVSLDYDVIKVNTDFYIYAILLDKSEGNYSMTLENVRYMIGNKISEEDLIRNFSINSQTADFYVKPGVIVAEADFFVEVQNLNENDITIITNTETNISGAREIFVEGGKVFNLPLMSGEIKKINFQLGNGKSAMRTIGLKSGNFTYTIPIYIPSSLGDSPESILFSLEPPELNISLPINKIEKKVIYLYNLGDTNLTDISLSLSDNLIGFVNLSEESIHRLDAHTSKPVELYILSKNQTKIHGEVLAQNKNIIVSSSIYVQFSSNYTKLNETYYSTTKTCAELNGTVYNTEIYECDQTPFSAKDNICCKGNLKKIKKDNSTSIIVAVILILIVVFGLVWFYFAKYKRTKRFVNLIKSASKKI